jgi:PAS domain S-box-containing protein
MPGNKKVNPLSKKLKGTPENLNVKDTGIDERKRLEEKIFLNHFSIDQLRDMAFWTWTDGRIFLVNKEACNALGYTMDELLSLSIPDIDMNFHQERLSEFIEQNKHIGYVLIESRFKTKDGRTFPVEICSNYLYFGNKEYMVSLCRDITERKRADEAVMLAGVYNRSLIESSLDPLVTISPDGVITDVNKATEAVTGYSRHRLINTDFCDYFTEPEKAKEGYRTAFKQGSVKDYALEIRHKDGRITPVIYNASVYRDESGRVIGVFAAARDITERKQAENALQDAKDQVELYVDLMGHDINNMNQVSMGFLELAHNIIEMEGMLGEDNIILLDKAMDSLKSSSQLIDNVRKLQRERIGLYEPEVLDVGRMIEDVEKQFHVIPGRDVRITCAATGDCIVKANALLKDVFTNLIGNAVKHSKGALMVNVLVRRVTYNAKPCCRIDVEDDGPGIPDALKNTLFDRLSLTTTRAKGKGFGLCLIKMLVDDYRGKFWVEDRVAGDHTKGARFVVVLPAVEK